MPQKLHVHGLILRKTKAGWGGRGDQVLQAVTHANLETAQQAVTAPDPVSLRLRVLCSDALGLG